MQPKQNIVVFVARWRRNNWEIKLMEQPDEHYSLVGGNLVINNPRGKKHAGTYICVARNLYGTVISKEAKISFGCERLKPAEAGKLDLANVSARPKSSGKISD